MNKKVRHRDKTGVYYFKVEASEDHIDKVKFYSVLLGSRTVSLNNLLVEEFTSCLRRVECGLRSKKHIQCNGYAERVIIDYLTTVPTTAYIKNSFRDNVTWVRSDSNLYADLICKECVSVFQPYIDLCSTEDGQYLEDVAYRTSVWKDSLKCVQCVVNALHLNINL